MPDGGARLNSIGRVATDGPNGVSGSAQESSMAAARAGASTNLGGSREPWELDGVPAEKQALATSRDAELATELVVREALEKGVNREVVMAAQEIGEADPADEVEIPVAGKDKA